MRAIVLAAAFMFSLSGFALADESVAGHWKSELGSSGASVVIDMTVTADGRWSSKTSENDQEVANMRGTYQQTVKTPTSGQLVFTPTQGTTSELQGGPQVETDDYQLSDGVLSLTSDGDTLVFHKQTE